MVKELEERLHRRRRKFKQLAKVLGQKIYTGIFVESEVIPEPPEDTTGIKKESLFPKYREVSTSTSAGDFCEPRLC